MACLMEASTGGIRASVESRLGTGAERCSSSVVRPALNFPEGDLPGCRARSIDVAEGHGQLVLRTAQLEVVAGHLPEMRVPARLASRDG